MTYVDNRPRTLTAWRLSNDKSLINPDMVNVGTEFAGYDAPKLKFLFTVSFRIRNPEGGDLGINPGSDNMADIMYACKSVNRPNITVAYTDVNSYNYRYKVATKVDFGTVTLTLYDDNKNLAHNLFTGYLNYISPVSNMSVDDYALKKGIPFDTIQNFSSLGPLGHPDGMIQSMRVTHHFNSGNLDDSTFYKKVHYDYINPKVQTFMYDDLDMGASDASMVSATFVYDSVNIITETTRNGVVTVGELDDITNDAPVQIDG